MTGTPGDEDVHEGAVAPLPTGTVTFLVTDIEGSTRLWETEPRAMARSLALHNETLRAALEGHDAVHVHDVGLTSRSDPEVLDAAAVVPEQLTHCGRPYIWGVAARPSEIIRFIGRSAKRIIVSAVGAVFVLAGLAMLVLPGPGILVVAIGFAILGTEYAWAAAALERTKRLATQAGGMARDGMTRAARAAQGTGRSAGRRIFHR